MSSASPWYKSSCHIETSLWRKTAPKLPVLEELLQDTKVNVAIIGAGFCGLSSALHLSESSVSVVVVDAHEPGWGASGRNGGQVIPGLKIQPEEIEGQYGINCDLRKTGWIQLANGG